VLHFCFVVYFPGAIGGQPKPPHVLGIFKRDSMGSGSGSRRDSLQSQHQMRMDSPRHSITSEGSGGTSPLATATFGVGDNLDFPPPSTPTGLMPGRRGSSFIGMPIPEVAEENERDSSESDHIISDTSSSSGSKSAQGGKTLGTKKSAPASTSTPSNSKFTVESSDTTSSNKPALEKIEEAEDSKSYAGSASRSNSDEISPVEATNLQVLASDINTSEEGKRIGESSRNTSSEDVPSETKL